MADTKAKEIIADSKEAFAKIGAEKEMLSGRETNLKIKENVKQKYGQIAKGKLKLNFKNQQLVLDEGEGFVVKNGTIHQSEADEETVVLLVEPINIVTKGDWVIILSTR